MTTTTQPGTPAVGVLRLTWVSDQLAHVLQHAGNDEPPGTWTGLACPANGLRIGAAVEPAVLRRLCASGHVADLIWEPPADLALQYARSVPRALRAGPPGTPASPKHQDQTEDIWPAAQSASAAALAVLQDAGIARFAPVRPQNWVVAAFDHHRGSHGLARPHIHNVVITGLTTGRQR